MSMKIASIQLKVDDQENAEQRIDKVDAALEQAKNFDLIMLPEIWMTGYNSFDRYIDESEGLDGKFIGHFSQKAKALHVYLFAGSFVEKKSGKYYNTSVLFDPQGKMIAVYRKIHLFTYGSQEGVLLTRGSEPVVTDTDFGKVGLSTCYDLRFPELYRRELDLGAKLFLVTSAWPLVRLYHWQLFNAARAIENQCYLASCNCVGVNRGVILGGNSRVIDPWGTIIASAGENESLLKAEIDPARVDRIREAFPQLKHRVPIG